MEAEEEPFEEELVANALSEMRKREALSLLSGADTKAKVYPAPNLSNLSNPSLSNLIYLI